jgi:hypothetical protein
MRGGWQRCTSRGGVRGDRGDRALTLLGDRFAPSYAFEFSLDGGFSA